MPNIYNIFPGGGAPDIIPHLHTTPILPSTECDRKDLDLEPAAHKGGIHRFNLNTMVDFKGCKVLKDPKNLPQQEEGAPKVKPIWNAFDPADDNGSVAMQRFLETLTLEVGDVFQTNYIPNRMLIDYTQVNIIRPVPGFEFCLRLRSGCEDDETITPLGAPYDGGLTGLDSFTAPFELTPRHWTGGVNDMIQMEIKALPENPEDLCFFAADINVVGDYVCNGRQF